MKLALNIEKRQKAKASHSRGHNLREHPTDSQLPKAAWFTPQGHHSISPWRDEVMQRAHGLAKRKDAVVAVNLTFQVGNQTDWRQAPTAEHPHGKPQRPVNLNELARAVREAVEAEFGRENVVSIDMHTDESTPHVHVVVTPIWEGKLQAKHWLDGPKSMAAIRERLHATISRRVACEYTPGSPGGEPHDVGRAAGGPRGPKQPPGLLQRVADAFEARAEIKTLKGVIAGLQEQMQGMFSSMKATERAAADRYDAMQAERLARAELQQKLGQAQLEIKRQRAEIERLTAPEQAKPAEQAKPVNAPRSPVVAPSSRKNSGPRV